MHWMLLLDFSRSVQRESIVLAEIFWSVQNPFEVRGEPYSLSHTQGTRVQPLKLLCISADQIQDRQTGVQVPQPHLIRPRAQTG